MTEEKPLFHIAVERIVDRLGRLRRADRDSVVRTVRHALSVPRSRRRRVRRRAAKRLARILFPELRTV